MTPIVHRVLRVDLALARTFSLHEQRSCQVHLEAYNLANHPNYGIPRRILESPMFGKAVDANRATTNISGRAALFLLIFRTSPGDYLSGILKAKDGITRTFSHGIPRQSLLHPDQPRHQQPVRLARHRGMAGRQQQEQEHGAGRGNGRRPVGCDPRCLCAGSASLYR
jgi:hypothetical protein